MKFKNLGLIIVSFFIFCQSTFAENATLTYQNQRGSQLILQLTSQDTLTGTFTTAVASKECQQAIGMKRPVMGLLAKNALTFSVNYPECGSVVTFIGHFEKDKKIINTTAIIVHDATTVDSQMIAHDVFKRVS